MAHFNAHTAYTFDDVLIRPRSSVVEPKKTNVQTALARDFFIDIPIVSAAMDTVSDDRMAIALGTLGGLAFIHRNQSAESEVAMILRAKLAGVRVGAACGPFDFERARMLIAAGADILAVDSAHGHNEHVIEGSWQVKCLAGKVPVTVGNVATAEAGRRLAEFADAIKVGIGPGSICTTRIVSGVGVPQLSALLEVTAAVAHTGVPVIADGGMRTSGDIAKALAAGASAVMLGNLLAATDAAPGELIEIDGKKYKQYRGMGSRAVLEEGMSNDRYLGKSDSVVPEGVTGSVLYTGTTEEVVKLLVGGIRVSMGYIGARTLEEFTERAEFQVVSPASIAESRPHSLSQIFG